MSIGPKDGPSVGELGPKRVEIVVSGATVLKAALIGLAVYLTIVASEVILTIGLACVFAFGLDPLVGVFTRRGMGRGKAALLVFALIFVFVAVLVIWVATPIWNEVRNLADDLPGYIEDLKDEPIVSTLHENTDVADKAQSLAQDVAQKIPEAANALLGITGSLVGSVLSVVTLVFLTLFLLIGRARDAASGRRRARGLAAGRGDRDDLLLAARQPRHLGDRRDGGGRRGGDHRGAVPGRARRDSRPVRPDSADRLFDRGDHRRPDLPAGRELRDPAARIPPGGRALRLRHDRRRARGWCVTRGDRRHPGRARGGVAQGRPP
jgi:uncharacterized protein YoxC